MHLCHIDKFDETKDKSDKKDNKKFEKLIAKVKDVLGEKVADVRISNKLVDSTCCLVASDSGMDVHMERMMMLQNKDFKALIC